MKHRYTVLFSVLVSAAILSATACSASSPSPLSKPNVSPLIVLENKYAKVGDQPLSFRHGDCSWLPELALQAGWKAKQIPRLTQIVLRESGCCPYRRGGDIVDKNCVVTGVSTWTHRSDSGLTQINGVHWKQDHAQYAGLVCKQMKICTQEPLLDALTNLKAARLLFMVAGWQPWGV